MTVYHIKLYFVTLAAFLAIDAVWLGLVARTFYRKYLDWLMATHPNWVAALAFYLLFVVGVMVFVVVPGVEDGSLRMTLLKGALFGLIAYGTYDLTNLATVKNWPLTITAVDMVWGTALSVVVSYIGFTAGKWLS